MPPTSTIGARRPQLPLGTTRDNLRYQFWAASHLPGQGAVRVRAGAVGAFNSLVSDVSVVTSQARVLMRMAVSFSGLAN